MISIIEARKILGKEYDQIADEKIAKIVEELEALSHIIIDHIHETVIPNINSKTLELLETFGYKPKKIRQYIDYKDLKIGGDKINQSKYLKFLEDYKIARKQAKEDELKI